MNPSSTPKSVVLGRLLDRHRPVVVVGPTADDPRVRRQSHAWVGPLPEAGLKDRDMVVIEVLGRGAGTVGGEALGPDEADQLRAAFGVADDAFAVVLIGRDGGEKERWADPVSAQEVFGKVDAMPMREQEVRERGGGSD